MTETLAQTIGLAQSMLLQGFIVFLRVGAIMVVLPAFGEQTVPVRIRLALALCFSMIAAPAVPPISPDLPQGVAHALLAETATGLMIGIGIRLLVLALQTAGSIAAQATSLAQIFGGAAGEPLPAIGHILLVAGLALAVTSGLHVKVAELLIQSYRAFPAGQFPLAADLSRWGIDRVAQAFSLAFTLAAPFVIMSVLYNLTLGAINRAMPQLMVAFVGAPVITAGGLFLLFLLSPILLSRWNEDLFLFIANPFGAGP